jgi:hypothetical protein
VDLTREELVQNLIARCSDELLKELDVYEKECKSNLPKKNVSLDLDLRETKTNITNWETKVKHLVVDDDLWKSIQQQSELDLARLKSKNKDFENQMFISKSTKAEIESNFSNVLERFGRILGISRFSTILKHHLVVFVILSYFIDF